MKSFEVEILAAFDYEAVVTIEAENAKEATAKAAEMARSSTLHGPIRWHHDNMHPSHVEPGWVIEEKP